MASVLLEAVVDVKDKASSKLANFNTSFGKLAGAIGIGTLAANAFSKATSLVTDTLKGSIQAARDAETSNVKVNAIVNTLTGSITKNRQEIEKSSKAALQLGFDDEDAAESMAKLMQATGDTTKANLAFQNAMDLARFKGIELKDSTNAVNLAMQGNTRVLKQLGIDIPDNATKMELLGLIHDKVKNQAVDFGNSAAGAAARYQAASENLREAIGARLTPVIAVMQEKISAFISGDKLEGWLKKIDAFVSTKVIPTFQAIGSFFVNVLGPALRDNIAPAFEKAFEAIKPHLPMLGQVAKVLGIIVGGAIVGGLIIVSNIIAAMVGLFAKILDVITMIVDGVKRFIDQVKKIGDVGGSIGNFVGGLIPGRASGGPVAAGQPYMVGEQGPELFVPSGNGTIIPNGQGGGGTVTVNFINPVVQGEKDMERMVREIQKAMGESQRLYSIGAI